MIVGTIVCSNLELAQVVQNKLDAHSHISYGFTENDPREGQVSFTVSLDETDNEINDFYSRVAPGRWIRWVTKKFGEREDCGGLFHELEISVPKPDLSVKYYQLTLEGYDGNSDATDDCVKWVRANSVEQVKRYADSVGWTLDGHEPTVIEDFVLCGIDADISVEVTA